MRRRRSCSSSNGRELVTTVGDVLVEAMVLYNDHRYRRSAEKLIQQRDELTKQIGALEQQIADATGQELTKLQSELARLEMRKGEVVKRLDAYKENIRTSEFKNGL